MADITCFNDLEVRGKIYITASMGKGFCSQGKQLYTRTPSGTKTRKQWSRKNIYIFIYTIIPKLLIPGIHISLTTTYQCLPSPAWQWSDVCYSRSSQIVLRNLTNSTCPIYFRKCNIWQYADIRVDIKIKIIQHYQDVTFVWKTTFAWIIKVCINSYI